MLVSNIRKIILISGSFAFLSMFLFSNSVAASLNDEDVYLALNFIVEKDLNPDEGSFPSPLFIRVYELKTTKAFNKINFIELYERDEEILSNDLIKVHKLKRIRPGENREDWLKLDSGTKYIGLFAEFLRYKNSKHKLIIPVSQYKGSTERTIRLFQNKAILKEKSR